LHESNSSRSESGGDEEYGAPGRATGHGETPSPDQDRRSAPRHVATGVAKLGVVVRRQAWQARGRTGLTPTQAQILLQLRAAEPEALTLRALAQALGVTSATASESLDTLVGKGMAMRARSPRDARALAVRLTDIGRREADAGGASTDALLAAARDIVETEEAGFLRGLTRMLHRLEEDGRISHTRMCASCRYFRPNAHAESSAGPHHCAFVDVPFHDRQLRIDCADHERADPDMARRNWQIFAE